MKSKILIQTIAHIAMVLTMISASATVSYGQDYVAAPVTISKEKVRVSGKLYYSHIVKEKQTLFSIAKAYEVTLEQIYESNPDLKDNGLKKNSIILIPVAAEESTPKQTPAPKADAKGVEKVNVNGKEVKQQPVEEWNGSVSKSWTPPQQEQKTEPDPKAQPEKQSRKKQKVHTVKWFEDLDVIADKYGVTVEALMKANNLTGRKLTKRQKLVIPEPGEYEEAAVPAPDETAEEPVQPEDSAPLDITADVQPEETPLWIFQPKDKVKATLILPMRASTENVSRNNMDFYSGVLLAVKDLGESGIKTELNVYDSVDSSHPIAGEDIEESDMVIGPVSYSDLTRLLASEVEPKALISPLDPRAESLALTHPNFIQAPTPHKVIYDDLVSWIKEDTVPGDTLIIISEKGVRQSDAADQIRQAADSSGLDFLKFSYSILEGRDVIEPLTDMMTATGTNRIMIASESEAFVNDVVRNLSILIYNKLNVVLYAPSKIRSFETIEVENLHNTSLHVSMGYYIDYESQQVKNFLLKYRALFNTEPSQYAFQGYDIATYFISMCSRYGNRWMKKLDGNEQSLLQSTFECRPVFDGGFVNNGVRRVIYGKNWTVEKVL